MKFLIATLSFLAMLFSCNSSNKKISQIEVIETVVDTLKKSGIPDFNISKDFVLGKFDYKTDSTFTKVNTEHSAKIVHLNKEVYIAFIKMHKAASSDSIDLNILSGTRNFNEQKAIWERKWNMYSKLKPLQRAQKILEYSSMPSSSRHHWGTDLDLNSLSNSYFSSGKGKAIYKWLNENANDFGFYQVYTNKDNGRTGYNLEKWHWSYLPLASKYLEFYNSYISVNDIIGFKGSELAKELNITENYVNGISEKAKNYK